MTPQRRIRAAAALLTAHAATSIRMHQVPAGFPQMLALLPGEQVVWVLFRRGVRFVWQEDHVRARLEANGHMVWVCQSLEDLLAQLELAGVGGS